MSPERQRVVIGELRGWFFSDRSWHMPNGAKATADGGPDLPPDYLNDLNAMHDALKILSHENNPCSGESQVDSFLAWLGYCGENNTSEVFAAVHATAAQRAEALLRTLNKWEES